MKTFLLIKALKMQGPFRNQNHREEMQGPSRNLKPREEMKTLPELGNTAKKCKQILLPKQGDKMQTFPVFRNPARKCNFFRLSESLRGNENPSFKPKVGH